LDDVNESQGTIIIRAKHKGVMKKKIK
jgi:hypothetical protein